jgi:hypothetical protein
LHISHHTKIVQQKREKEKKIEHGINLHCFKALSFLTHLSTSLFALAMESISPSKYAIIRWFKLDQFEPERAVTSHWVSSTTFLLIRTLPTLYAIIVMFADIGTTAQAGTFKYFFAYFTNLTYVGLFSYLVVTYS